MNNFINTALMANCAPAQAGAHLKYQDGFPLSREYD